MGFPQLGDSKRALVAFPAEKSARDSRWTRGCLADLSGTSSAVLRCLVCPPGPQDADPPGFCPSPFSFRRSAHIAHTQHTEPGGRGSGSLFQESRGLSRNLPGWHRL